MPSNTSLITTEEFAKRIRDESFAGYGFVPFLGSGISLPSGILTGQKFDDYLAWTVFICVLREEDRWDLKKKGWPAMPSLDDSQKARVEIFKVLKVVATRLNYKVKNDNDDDPKDVSLTAKDNALTLTRPMVPKILASSEAKQQDEKLRKLIRELGKEELLRDYPGSPDTRKRSQAFINELAIRSLYEWRATLCFLARLEINGGRLSMGEIDGAVIDQFNIMITGGHKPNLIHHMLAHLSRPLRIRTLLTTNFDNLIEQAFEAAAETLTVFEVSRQGGLPAADSVISQTSLVKLHGGLLETRADFSLDDDPTEVDFANFSRYVLPSKQGQRMLPNHLLVMGYSASDMRCVQFIKELLEQSKDILIFWVCYSSTDSTKLPDVFYEHFEDGKSNQFILVESQRADLLLYEVYQRRTLALPPGAQFLQFSHRVPPVVESSSAYDEAASKKWITELAAAICRKGDEALPSNLPNVTVNRQAPLSNHLYLLDGNQVISLAQRLHTELRQKKHKQTIWLEMQDFTSPDEILEDILRTICLRTGQFQLEHVDLRPPAIELDARKRWLQKLLEHLRVQMEEWVIMLYGRTVPGACAGWQGTYWERTCYTRFNEVLQLLLNGNGKQGFRIIYMPFSQSRFDWHKSRVEWAVNQLSSLMQDSAVRWTFPSGVSPETDWHLKPWLQAASDHIVDSVLKEEFRAFHEQFSKSPPTSVNVDQVTVLAPATATSIDISSFSKKISDFFESLGCKLAAPFAGYELSDESKRLLRFYHGLCIFRQSRHPNALISEVAFPCPEPFNAEGKDNDWERNAITESWQAKQNTPSQNIFAQKPGGYSWVYRDVRICLLRMIEAMPFWKQNGQMLLSMAHRRSSIHAAAAAWYLRAFYATGHITPLMECLHHRLQAILSARFYRPQSTVSATENEADLLIRRLSYMLRDLLDLRRNLKLARPQLLFWLSQTTKEVISGGEHIRTEVLMPLSDWTQAQMSRLESQDEALTKARSLSEGIKLHGEYLAQELDDLSNSVTAASGNRTSGPIKPSPAVPHYEQDYEAYREKRTLPVEKGAGWVHNSVHVIGHPERDWRRKLFPWLWPDAAAETNKKKHWQGIIDTVLLLEKMDQALADGHDAPTAANIASMAKQRRKWQQEHGSDQARLQQAVQVTIELAYLHVKRVKVLGHAQPSLPQKRSKLLWVQVSLLCHQALRLREFLDPAFLRFDLEQQIKAQTLYGLTLGHLGRFFEAHRRLNEAQALLSKLNPVLDPLELAIIHLRRSEVYLVVVRAAKDIEQKGSSGTVLDMAFAQALDRGKSQEKADQCARRIRVAAVDDAWACLESAENCLSGRSHSSLWWSRLCALKLRAYEEAAALQTLPHSSQHWCSLPFRKNCDHLGQLTRIYQAGLLMTGGDAYRDMRFIKFYCKALQQFKATGFAEAASAAIAKVGQDFEQAKAELDKQIGDKKMPSVHLLPDFAASLEAYLRTEGALPALSAIPS